MHFVNIFQQLEARPESRRTTSAAPFLKTVRQTNCPVASCTAQNRPRRRTFIEGVATGLVCTGLVCKGPTSRGPVLGEWISDERVSNDVLSAEQLDVFVSSVRTIVTVLSFTIFSFSHSVFIDLQRTADLQCIALSPIPGSRFEGGR